MKVIKLQQLYLKIILSSILRQKDTCTYTYIYRYKMEKSGIRVIGKLFQGKYFPQFQFQRKKNTFDFVFPEFPEILLFLLKSIRKKHLSFNRTTPFPLSSLNFSKLFYRLSDVNWPFSSRRLPLSTDLLNQEKSRVVSGRAEKKKKKKIKSTPEEEKRRSRRSPSIKKIPAIFPSPSRSRREKGKEKES